MGMHGQYHQPQVFAHVMPEVICHNAPATLLTN